ncbi:MAG: agmatinase [Candidatus Magasanikbacteria bacterium CG10_big_fil_rev_8_21_14_0_10_40_10]|uniref:Agmatinase n=1 Tax=Candidatus Magasanikbacteria bacterium CG10_big_fil_rev_8_21_14_0_10_40_10 TaxID=1974648 RepID=A0A2M6W2M7_9BACT|nr:MAG: agmatinase [Candidatus Magasanikbacteria bacterium CG10_big_fil_rev_8_21_14_0_10_40_10]
MNNTKQNFGGLEKKYSDYHNSKIVILPIPFDRTSTWGKGADKGPTAILEASANMELYDIETKNEVYKQGIFTASPIKGKNSEQMISQSYLAVKKFLNDNKLVVSLGGEHSIINGPLQAYAEKFSDLSVLHLDAHSDRRDSYEDSKFSHACVMARAQEMVKNVVSVGVRSLDVCELPALKKNKVFYAKDIVQNAGWIKNAIKQLSDQVYVTIDLDVFDPAFLPATGTPEPGGLDWYMVLKLIKEISQTKKIVGFDVVELAPMPNQKSSDFLAAKLIYKTLSYIYKK